MYRVFRKFEDIKLSVITSAVMINQSKNFTGFKNYSITRYPQCYNFYNRTFTKIKLEVYIQGVKRAWLLLLINKVLHIQVFFFSFNTVNHL